MSPYRTAILGCTDRGRMHAQAYQHIERGNLVACCDRHAEKRQAFADEFGLRAYADLEEMIHMEKPDLIHLVTAPNTRVEQMNLVSDLGLPACIVEKPIALEVRDWKALQELSHRTKTKFGVGAQFRYHPDLSHCREALQSGMLGALRFIDCSAVGTICDQGVHVLDWAMSLNDDLPVKRVFGTASGKENLSHPVHPSPDTTVAQLVFDNDVCALWNLGGTAPRVVDEPVYYKHCRVAAYAEKGHVLYEEFGRWEIVSAQGSESGYADQRGWREGNHLAQAGLTNAMFDWLENGTRPVGTNLQRSLQQWNVVLGLYASTVWRVPVELPFEPPEDLWSQLNTALQ